MAPAAGPDPSAARLTEMETDHPPAAPAWRCCLTTSDSTTISLSCPLERGQPWLGGRSLDVLRRAADIEVDPEGDRYAVGRRRGAPLILGEPLLWSGVPLILEALESEEGGAGEVTLRLPPWSQLASRIPEERLWAATDSLAAEFHAFCGVVSDGRAVGYPDLARPAVAVRRLQSLHLGVLLPPAWLGLLRAGSTPYREFPESGLVLVLE